MNNITVWIVLAVLVFVLLLGVAWIADDHIAANATPIPPTPQLSAGNTLIASKVRFQQSIFDILGLGAMLIGALVYYVIMVKGERNG